MRRPGGRGALMLTGIFAVLTLGWILVEPFADKSLATTVAGTIVALTGNLYRLAYGFICVLLLICLYNLSAKRWRNLGRPASFAGILPVAAAVTAALYWLEPRVEWRSAALLGHRRRYRSGRHFPLECHRTWRYSRVHYGTAALTSMR